jgi:alpha-glucosidase
MEDGAAWWREAVVYEVYPRSFADADGDGVGDLDGVADRLPYLAELGVDAVWLTPFQRSPQADQGYDVSDYCAVDPLFGDLAAFDRLLAGAHALGLRVVVDVVPNHCSSAHPLFVDALAAPPGSPERARFHFAPGRGAGPPNNWPSVFGGPAWTREPRTGEWYLHLFAPEQPDWNWRDPRTSAFFDAVLRFWFDRGVDGLRVDVAHGLVKAAGLPDLTPDQLAAATPGRLRGIPPACDQEEVHAIYRRWRALADGYGSRCLVGEVNLDPARAARYTRPDELHQAFAFGFLAAPWEPAAWARAGAELLAARVPGGGPVTWVAENHDVVRTPTRFAPPGDRGCAAGRESPVSTGRVLHSDRGGGCAAGRESPSAVARLADFAGGRRSGQRASPDDRVSTGRVLRSHRGGARARAALLVVLGLPGGAYLYQGQELGLPEVDVPAAARRDPMWARAGLSRDGCRVPMPWRRDPAGAFGFSGRADAVPWLPVPGEWGSWSVEAAEADPESTLHLCRAALAMRGRLHRAGVLTADDAVTWEVEGGRLVARRGRFAVVVAMGDDAVPLPAGEVLLATAPVVEGRLPADAAAWVRADEVGARIR